MGRWVVVLQSDTGSGSDYVCEEVARFEGTREQARARLYELACTHRPRPRLRQKRRDVHRIGDGDAYYARIEGRVLTFAVIYQLAELVWSTEGEPEQP
ncbi:hypothetical protein [Streptomyces sp. NPDC093990]|uniref:hypothetical protein n=1 Tax=Streptomyces sp. NPDC093990 TaxID=3155306 RepID=UPI00342A1BF0